MANTNRSQNESDTRSASSSNSNTTGRSTNAGQFKKGDARTREAGRKGGEASRGGGRNS